MVLHGFCRLYCGFIVFVIGFIVVLYGFCRLYKWFYWFYLVLGQKDATPGKTTGFALFFLLPVGFFRYMFLTQAHLLADGLNTESDSFFLFVCFFCFCFCLRCSFVMFLFFCLWFVICLKQNFVW